jgi:hypothetical protein
LDGGGDGHARVIGEYDQHQDGEEEELFVHISGNVYAIRNRQMQSITILIILLVITGVNFAA